jgi:hypothetical protein
VIGLADDLGHQRLPMRRSIIHAWGVVEMSVELPASPSIASAGSISEGFI